MRAGQPTVIRHQRERVFIVVEGALAIAHLLIGKPAPSPSIRIVGIEAEGLVEVAQRGFEFSCLQVQGTPSQVELRLVAWNEPTGRERLVVVGQRLAIHLELQVGLRPPQVVETHPRCKPHRLAVLRNGSRELLARGMHPPLAVTKNTLSVGLSRPPSSKTA
jgi:hypothetical protein